MYCEDLYKIKEEGRKARIRGDVMMEINTSDYSF